MTNIKYEAPSSEENSPINAEQAASMRLEEEGRAWVARNTRSPGERGDDFFELSKQQDLEMRRRQGLVNGGSAPDKTGGPAR